MLRSLRRARQVVFGVAVAGSLAFGGSQALASQPAADAACDEEGQIYVGTCPSSNCNNLCAGGFGVCRSGCCTCKI
jgi:hypothetical protein